MEISEIVSQSKGIHQWIVEKRRTIHRHPELMYEEFETSKLVQNTLKELKIPPVTGSASLGGGRVSTEIRIPLESIKAGVDYFESMKGGR